MNLTSFAWLIPLLPLLAALQIAARIIAGRCDEPRFESATAALAQGAVALALLLLLALDGLALWQGTPGTIDYGVWFTAGEISLPLSIILDRNSLAVATLAALILLLVQRFSRYYMHREAGYHRFYMAMSLFAGAMLLIVLAGNALFTFIGWELAGVSSYLLIGYSQDRATATGNAVRAFVTNRIGDAGLLLGIVLALLWVGSLQWEVIGSRAGQLETLAVGLMTLGFVVAALAKSAQVPFIPWIARALEGPTPSSAIFYGSLMVHAGVYLLLRLEPLLLQAPALMGLLVVLGLLTALYGLLVGMTQADVKSSLIASTSSQVGLMFAACGLGWFEVAFWHLLLHAAWRAYQFLVSPAYLFLVSGSEGRAFLPWLARSRRLHAAARNRFWLESLTDWLLVRPTHALARDVDQFDERVVAPAFGVPDETQSEAPGRGELVRGDGIAGRLLLWFADTTYRFEQRLVFRKDGGLAKLLRRIGDHLVTVEGLLERPRYLLLLIMVTLVVIL